MLLPMDLGIRATKLLTRLGISHSGLVAQVCWHTISLSNRLLHLSGSVRDRCLVCRAGSIVGNGAVEMTQSRKLRVEPLESRRLLAQLPQSLGMAGICGSPKIFEESGLAYFAGHPGSRWFGCGSPNYPQDLWRTDGTADGTYPLGEDVGVAIHTERLVEFDNDVFFRVESTGFGSAHRLIRSDGTPKSGVEISYWGGAAEPFELGGETLFVYVDAARKEQEIRKIVDSGVETVIALPDIDGPWETAYSRRRAGESVVFFIKGDLWRSDGTSEGTFLLRNLNPTTSPLSNILATVGTDRVLFFARDDAGAPTLWSTNGTTAGTFMVKQIDPGGSSVVGIGEIGSERWLFTSTNKDRSTTLWVTDGSRAGTKPLGEIDVASIYRMERIGERYFIPPAGRDITATDGGSIVDLLEITERADFAYPSNPNYRVMPVFNFGSELYFHTNRQLWQTDGTPEGTRSVANLGTGVLFEQHFDGRQFSGFQSHATQRYFYFEQDSPAGLFRVDRNTGETRTVVNEPVTLQAGASDFLIYEIESSETSWVFADTAPAPTSMSDQFAVEFDSFELLVDGNERVLFRGTSPTGEDGYWLTDGTPRGTLKISELPEGGADVLRRLDAEDNMIFETRNFFQFMDSVIFEATFLTESLREVLSTQLFSIDLRQRDQILGDIDQNGVVDFLDFLILADHFGHHDVTSREGDLDGDGEVSLADLALLQQDFSKNTVAAVSHGSP